VYLYKGPKCKDVNGPGLWTLPPKPISPSDSDSSRSDDDEVWSSSLQLATTILIAEKEDGGAEEGTHKGVPTINVIKSIIKKKN